MIIKYGKLEVMIINYMILILMLPETKNPVEINISFTISLSKDTECLSIDNIESILHGGFQLTVNGTNSFINSLSEISNSTFVLNLQNTNTYISSTTGIVEQILNENSVGLVFPNLVTNGDFSSGNTNGWTGAGSAVLSNISGNMRVTNGSNTTGSGNQSFAVTAGKRYYIKAQSKNATSSQCTLTVRGLTPTTTIASYIGTANTNFYQTFIAATDTLEVRCINNSSVNGEYTEWDNIEVKEVDAILMPDITKRPIVQTALDGNKYLVFNGSNSFMYGAGNVLNSNFTKVITFEWDSTALTLADNHLIASLVNNIHSLAIVKTNSTTVRFKDGLSTSAQYDILISSIQGQRVTLIETWGGGTKQIYLNGIKIAENNTSQTITDKSFLLCSFNNGSASTFFKGKIFEMGIYNEKKSLSEILKIDDLQNRKFRVPQGNYYIVAGAGESVEVGYATNQPSDPIIAGAGINYLPSLNLFRYANDVNGDSYSASLTGSKIPPLCNKIYSLTNIPVMYVQTAKGGSTVSSISASGDDLTHWGTNGTLRYNSSIWIKKMLNASNKINLPWLILNIGENDVIYKYNNPSWTKELFKQAYQNLIDYYKIMFPNIKIIIVKSMNQRAFPSDTIIYGSQTQSINEAQEELVLENNNCFLDTSPTSFTITNGNIMPDGQHYSKTGNLIVGEAQGNIIITN